MRKISLKLYLIIMIVVLFFCLSIMFIDTNNDNIAFASPMEGYIDSGLCGESVNWYYYEDSNTLFIEGVGSINSYTETDSPWKSYVSNIKTLLVDDSVTSIGKGAFQDCTSLEEITLPFVGKSRTAVGYEATFGFIFGYTSYSVQLPANNNSSIFNYTFDGFSTGNSLTTGHVSAITSTPSSSYYDCYTYKNSYKVGDTYYPYNCWEKGSLNKTIKVTSDTNAFTSYILGSSSTTRYNPTNTTWQYSCYNVNVGIYNSKISSDPKAYGLSCYFYNIPSSISRVTITDASKIETAAFMNCTNIIELNLNTNITYIGGCAFQNLGYKYMPEDDFVVSGDILLNYKGTAQDIDIPSNIRIIAPGAFWGNTTLTNVNIPESVIFIGLQAFYNCSNAIINIPKISGSIIIGNNGLTNVKQVIYKSETAYTNGNDTYYYSIVNDEAEIVSCSTTSTNMTLPTTLGGYNVTKVGYKGMANCTTLASITIPSNILLLDSYSFYGCSNITTVTIPETCTIIGDYAFMNCTNLHSVTISEGVLYVGDFSFYGCSSLTEIVIPDTCSYLGDYAFYECTSLETASIGITVPNVNDYTFYNCTSLVSVVLGISIETIGDYAFYNSAITRITTPNALRYIGNYAYSNCSTLERVTLRNGFEIIGDGSFYNCNQLSNINLVSSIMDIGAYAFYGCSSLLNITIPSLVDEINDYTFAYCTSLSSVTINGSVNNIGNKAFYKTTISTFDFGSVLSYIGYDAFAYTNLSTISLPNSLNYIGEQAFSNCLSLNTISLPDDIAFVGGYAFPRNVNNLTFTIRYHTGVISNYLLSNTNSYKVIICEGITDIGDYAFAYNEKLYDIVFPSTLINIGNYAFYENRGYSEITLPANTKTLGDYAFARGYILSLIRIPDSISSIGTKCFERCEDKKLNKDITIQLYYHEGVICDGLLRYQKMHHIEVDDLIYSIGDYAFANIEDNWLKTVQVPDTISSFGDNVFYGNGRITLIINKYDGLVDNDIYRDKLKTSIDLIINDIDVGDYAFYGCTGLLNATINDSNVLGSYAFYNCYSMTTFTINGDVTTIKEHCFDSCKALQSMTLPVTVNYIGEYAYYDCNSMTAINIPTGIEKILSHTFYGCSSLISIVTPNTIDEIQEYAFYGCIAASTIIISSNCELIGDYTFYNCKAVEELVIPNSVHYIGEYAFRSCIKITELRLSDYVEEIGACAFYDCNLLETIYLGKRIIELKDRLFYACVNLSDLYVYAPLSYIHELAFYGAEDCVIHIGNDSYMIGIFDELGLTYVIDNTIIYEYKVVFLNWNDSIISSLTYYLGDNIIVPAPTRPSDNTYSYTFISWDKDVIMNCNGNATYKAQYSMTYIDYTITFKNYDNSILSSETYHYGDTVVAPTTPTKASDNTYNYVFNGWDREIEIVTESTSYIATYSPVYIEYNVSFVDYNGSIISSDTYHYGEEVEIPTNPTREADNTYTYTFNSWDKEVVAVEGDTTYTATYTPTYIEYTITFKNYDGSVLTSNTYHYGDTVVEPATPAKLSDEIYDYIFVGWDSNIVNCDGNKIYIALFNHIESERHQSMVLLNELLEIVDSIQDVNLATYSIIISIKNRAENLNDTDKIKLDLKITPIISQYIEYVKSINNEYKIAQEIEKNFFNDILEMVNYLSLVAYLLLKGRRWFL